jgi:hypothetical protein
MAAIRALESVPGGRANTGIVVARELTPERLHVRHEGEFVANGLVMIKDRARD